MASHKKDLKHNTLNKQTCNPDFYICCELPCKIPGNSFVLIEVKEDHGVIGSFIDDETIAQTEIDLEDRYFNRKWH